MTGVKSLVAFKDVSIELSLVDQLRDQGLSLNVFGEKSSVAIDHSRSDLMNIVVTSRCGIECMSGVKSLVAFEDVSIELSLVDQLRDVSNDEWNER